MSNVSFATNIQICGKMNFTCRCYCDNQKADWIRTGEKYARVAKASIDDWYTGMDPKNEGQHALGQDRGKVGAEWSCGDI